MKAKCIPIVVWVTILFVIFCPIVPAGEAAATDESTPKSPAEEIQFYEEVLANTIQMHPLNRIGFLLFDYGNPWLMGESDEAAKERNRLRFEGLKTIVAEYPCTAWEVYRAYAGLADEYATRGQRKEAEALYLFVYRFPDSLRPEEAAEFRYEKPPFGDDLPRNWVEMYRAGEEGDGEYKKLRQDIKAGRAHAREALAHMYARAGEEGIPALKRIIRDNGTDAELVKAAEEGLSRVAEPGVDISAIEAEPASEVAAIAANFPPRLPVLPNLQPADPLLWLALYGTEECSKFFSVTTTNDALNWMAMSFNLPICFEQPIYSLYDVEKPSALPGYQIASNQTLKVALAQLCEKSTIPIRWDVIQGCICVLPVIPVNTRAFETGERSFLDVRVSLELDDVSTWEAMKALREAINTQLAGIGGRVRVYPGCVVRGYHPDPELTETRTVSVHVHDVSAREGACAIATASPMETSWRYEQNPQKMWGNLEFDTWRSGRKENARLAKPGELAEFSDPKTEP